MLKLTSDAPIAEHIRNGEYERRTPENSDKYAARGVDA